MVVLIIVKTGNSISAAQPSDFCQVILSRNCLMTTTISDRSFEIVYNTIMTTGRKFTFLDYSFDQEGLVASFRYQGIDDVVFTEKVEFARPFDVGVGKTEPEALERALFLCFMLIGTSYYKAHPTAEVSLDKPLDAWQAEFFNHVYQEGLSQYAYENGLAREDLAHFHPVIDDSGSGNGAVGTDRGESAVVDGDERDGMIVGDEGGKVVGNVRQTLVSLADTDTPRVLSLQSGGKDSLLTATLLAKNHIPYTAWYLTSGTSHPEILDRLPGSSGKTAIVESTSKQRETSQSDSGRNELMQSSSPLLQIAHRQIDLANLRKSGGLNGHVPVTYIVQSLALVQAILNGQTFVLTSIGQEGNEAHAYIGDLAVNHQWSKTWSAEQAFAEYVTRYVMPIKSIQVGSPLRALTELAIAGQFAKLCWREYGHDFSSCNEANYRQKSNNQELHWCGDCAKCANSYLLFAPFLAPEELQSIFNGEDLFVKPSLTEFFKGLLGVDEAIKPFECVGEVGELRRAYHLRRDGYGSLPFEVPESDFDYLARGAMQDELRLG